MKFRLAIVCLALFASACTSDDTTSGSAAAMTVSGSVNQVFVLDGPAGDDVELLDPDGSVVDEGTVDAQGALIFRDVDKAEGYTVRTTGDEPAESDPVDVESVTSSQPDQAFYDDQTLEPGFEYIETRDGTTLSAAVYLPGPIEDGPYPTVVEYSGYSPSNPYGSLEDDIGDLLGDDIDIDEICLDEPFVCSTPDQPGSLIASAMGYAVVAVNIRGTGCSGGAYDFFEPLQLTDGYDVIETAAAQDWVLNNKVGMVGLSYPGISQLFVASTQPPSLAAIAPLSVYDDTVRGVLAPGGIHNKGFALSWADSVLSNARPYGQGWSLDKAEDGDATCAANQKMRFQNVDASERALEHDFYPPDEGDPLNTSLLAHDIDVPVFLACGFQDEQTGGRCAKIADEFPNASPAKFTFYNGVHSDGLAPQVLVELKAFLDMYVADELTPLSPVLSLFGPALMEQVFGVPVGFPEQRWNEFDSAADARAAYEAEPPIRVLYENGNGADPGAPAAVYEAFYDEWPAGDASAEWYLHPDGTLRAEPPAVDGGASSFTHSPELGEAVTLPGDKEGQAFDALPEYEWNHDAEGDAAVFVTEPFAENTTMLGTGSADLWIMSDSDNVDLSVTLSEVRPDGQEMYVQSGWLRTAALTPGPDATDLDPDQQALEEDLVELPVGEWTEARIEIFPFAHLFRAGSQLRVSVHTPGGDRPRWSWILQDYDESPEIKIAHDADHPSVLRLPTTPTIADAPAELPPCPSLRGQPCREYQPYANRVV